MRSILEGGGDLNRFHATISTNTALDEAGMASGTGTAQDPSGRYWPGACGSLGRLLSFRRRHSFRGADFLETRRRHSFRGTDFLETPKCD